MSTQTPVPEAFLPTPSSDVLTWLGIDLDAFISGLHQRMPDTTRKVCESIGDDLLSLHPVLRHAFKFWWNTGEIPDLGSFSGYTVNDLTSGTKGTIKFRPSGLFLMLSMLISDPERANAQLTSRICGFKPCSDSERVLPARRKAN